MNLPAFPAMHYDLAENEHGLTMRDYFAAKAMQAIVSRGIVSDVPLEKYTENAYKMADAMMKAREA